MKSFKDIEFNVQVWKEGNMFVSYVPQLDLASCGKSVDDARKSIREALELFFEETEKMGTLQQVLEEAGFETDQKKHWRAPEMVAFERLKMAF